MIDEHRTFLNAAAITDDVIEEYGIRSITGPDEIPDEIFATWSGFLGEAEKGILFPGWTKLDGTKVVQYRPDVPIETPDGKRHKYVFPKDCGPVLWRLREPKNGNPDLFVEGTKQGLALASHVPEGHGVIVMAGCWSWSGADLSWADGREMVVFLDADLSSNRDVWDAADRLKESLADNGADPVRFARAAEARAKEGIDDVLGRKTSGRTAYLARLIKRAREKLPAAPRRRAPGFFDANGLLVKDLADAVLNQCPAALTHEGVIALYRNGVYETDHETFVSKVANLLGNDHRSTYLESVRQQAVARLRDEHRLIPAHADEPVLNCANGLLDLRTGELRPHTPEYLSTNQIPVEWHEDATCPHYAEWLEQMCPGQVDDLEETFSAMLDPSCSPLKNPFLYGPTRSGKSTMLRIAMAVVGSGNFSAVKLHELCVNRFKAAEVYGRMLNAGSDLSGQDVKDLSVFRMLTGADPVSAERKHQTPFTFTNRALFAFSANDLPQVSESHDAYFARIKPFRFGTSFLGHEDQEIERKIMTELPGILVRLVSAWQRRNVRGTYLPTPKDVQNEFETNSNRLRLFMAEELEAIPAKTDSECLGGMSLVSVWNHFETWAEAQKVGGLGRNKFGAWLRTVPGVTEVRITKDGRRGFNVRLKPLNPSAPKKTEAPADNGSGNSGSSSQLLGHRARGETEQGLEKKPMSQCVAETAGVAGRPPSPNGSGPADAIPEWAPGHYEKGSTVRCLGKTYRTKSDTFFAPTYDGWTEQP
ncbi:phage/plasmid primase, P4 family [Streptomyces sp. NBC_01622]|uniref:DNA primase family protein n=1 Tax=Streptomyces sp. NBC_01622 TaxID=2975903 RepID=UPI003868B15C|nr:phage/plasmid primase, P4 family [Streptomyces sp. NBC_01622]